MVAMLAIAWYAMMALHETGHVLHAWLSGGQVQRVVLPLADFSRTDVGPNPAPRFVAWGGAIWGCLLPLGLWGLWRARRWRDGRAIQFVAGFCCIANGCYLGAGVFLPVGDARDLMVLGTPRWALGCFGIAALTAGLYLWHRLGPNFGLYASGSVPSQHLPSARI